MLRNFNWRPNSPRATVRVGLIALGIANVIALYFVIRPVGGSAQELAQQSQDMRVAILQQQNTLDRTRLLASKIRSGRGEGDQFMQHYFLPRRSAYSTIMADLNGLAGESKITPRDSAWGLEAVDGSDTLDMMQVSANFEGTYPDLVHFVNLIDKSDRLLIIESLNATPQQSGGRINVTMKLDTFVQEDGSAQ